MSYYRDSPGKRSPYSRSPIRVLPSDRDFIEEEIQLKTALRAESDNRRLLDEISLLQLKLRKTDQLDAKCDSLIKQNSLLAHENEELARELSEKRYQLQRFRSNSAQLQERDSMKTGQLAEINRSLEIEIDLLKKERVESNQLYESHIQKLEFMLEDKIKELDSLSLKFNDLLNDKEISSIKFEEDRNKLKNMIVRTSHEMERELEFTKEKRDTEKYIELEALKKNYTSQIAFLEDENNKLKAANNYKNSEFENQLADNKAIRVRYDEEIRNLGAENDSLRERMLKLEEMNKNEVQTISGKYSDIHLKGTHNLKEEHGREINILRLEIERLTWLNDEKNNEIQHILREKRDQRNASEERELSLNSDLETLKNKLQSQQRNSSEQIQEQMGRINKLSDKLLLESESHHSRVKDFNNKVSELEGEVKHKQNNYDNLKREAQIKMKDLERTNEEINNVYERLRRDFTDLEVEKKSEKAFFDAESKKKQDDITKLSKQLNQSKVKCEELGDKFSRESENKSDDEERFKIEIKSLKAHIALLEEKLSAEQSNHSKEMEQLSNKLRERIEKLVQTQKETLARLEQTRNNELEVQKRRIELLEREKLELETKLSSYIRMYEELEKYFPNPHEGSLFEQKSDNNVYQVLSKVSKSTIHIF